MRVAQEISLDQRSRQQLERQARGRSVAFRVAVRSRIVLLAADGLQNKQIAEQLNISTRMAALWRNRFVQAGIVGLLKDAPRPGRKPSISAAVIDTVVAKTTQTNPVNATHWSDKAGNAPPLTDPTNGLVFPDLNSPPRQSPFSLNKTLSAVI
jgi:Winged helix-turn helix